MKKSKKAVDNSIIKSPTKFLVKNQTLIESFQLTDIVFVDDFFEHEIPFIRC